MVIITRGTAAEAVGETSNCIIVTDQHHIRWATGHQCPVFIVSNANHEIALNLADQIEKLGITKIISLGSGKVIDVSKFAAHLRNISHTTIPSCLSTNCFATDKGTLFIDGVKTTLQSKAPDFVVADLNLIAQSPVMNRCGIIELLSSATALTDWRLANTRNVEKIDDTVYETAQELVNEALNIANQNIKDPENLWQLMTLLKTSGELTQEYGSGRPVSGSEHILAASIENVYRCPHGFALYIAIQVGHAIQHTLGYNTQPLTVLQGMQDVRRQIKSTLNLDQVKNLLMKVQPRPDRFTCIDLINDKNLNILISQTCNAIFE